MIVIILRLVLILILTTTTTTTTTTAVARLIQSPPAAGPPAAEGTAARPRRALTHTPTRARARRAGDVYGPAQDGHGRPEGTHTHTHARARTHTHTHTHTHTRTHACNHTMYKSMQYTRVRSRARKFNPEKHANACVLHALAGRVRARATRRLPGKNII